MAFYKLSSIVTAVTVVLVVYTKISLALYFYLILQLFHGINNNNKKFYNNVKH